MSESDDLADRLDQLEVRLADYESLRRDLELAEQCIENLARVIRLLISDNNLTADEDVEKALEYVDPTDWVDLPAAGRQGPAPPLGERGHGLRWPQETLDAWERLWHTPQATQWRESDAFIRRP